MPCRAESSSPQHELRLCRAVWGYLFMAIVLCGCGGKSQSNDDSADDRSESTNTARDSNESSTSRNGEHVVSANGSENVDPQGNWSQFRGYRTQATSNNQSIPTTWSDDSNVIWKAPLHGRGSSSPIVHGDRIFVTAFSGYAMSPENPGRVEDLKYHLMCLDRDSGDLLWQKDIDGDPNTQRPTERILDHGLASSTPATDGESVFAFFGTTGVFAYDFDGELLWTKKVGEGFDNFGSASSPVIDGDRLLINASIESERIFAFDKKTGDELWSIPDMIRTWMTPVVLESSDGSRELVISQTDTIHGFDPETGEELWHCEGIHDYIIPGPAYHDGVCYFIAGRTKRFIAVRLGGRGDVNESHRLWERPIGANVPSPIYHAGHVFWPTDNGILHSATIEDGTVITRSRTGTKGRVYGSIVRAGDYFYLPLRDMGIMVFRADAQMSEVAVNRFDSDDGYYNATPAIHHGCLLIRTDSFLYCVGESAE